MRARRRVRADIPYINRELSWLEFNARVLHEARRRPEPAPGARSLPRDLRQNLDEFFQVRVAGLKQQAAAGRRRPRRTADAAQEQLALIRERVCRWSRSIPRWSSRLREELAEARRPHRRL